jgi:hypothetical protein
LETRLRISEARFFDETRIGSNSAPPLPAEPNRMCGQAGLPVRFGSFGPGAAFASAHHHSTSPVPPLGAVAFPDLKTFEMPPSLSSQV